MKSELLHKELFDEISRASAARKQFIKVLREGHLSRSDCESAIEALYLRSFSSFELLLDELFWGLLTGKIRHSYGCRSEYQFVNREVAVRYVMQGQFVKWLPFSGAIEFTKHFFAEGCNPYVLPNESQKFELSKCVHLRNAIAHRSEGAIKKFEVSVCELKTLPKGDQSVAGYLMSTHSRDSSKFDYHCGELLRFSRVLCHGPREEKRGK